MKVEIREQHINRFYTSPREFYGTQSPYADLLDAYVHPLPLYHLPEGKGVKNKQEALIRPIYCTLEEVSILCLMFTKVDLTQCLIHGITPTST